MSYREMIDYLVKYFEQLKEREVEREEN